MRATIDWDVRKQKSGWRKSEEVCDEGVVLDLSLDGALIQTPLESDHKAGTTIVVRLGGATGEVKVRHVRLSDDGATRLYGVRFIHTPELRDAVENGVEQLRENSAAVRRAWEDAR